MKEISKDVKSAGKVIATVKCPQADTWPECVKLAGDEKKAIAVFNAQWLTNAMNKTRRPSEGGLGKLIAKAPPEAKKKIEEILKAAGITL